MNSCYQIRTGVCPCLKNAAFVCNSSELYKHLEACVTPAAVSLLVSVFARLPSWPLKAAAEALYCNIASSADIKRHRGAHHP